MDIEILIGRMEVVESGLVKKTDRHYGFKHGPLQSRQSSWRVDPYNVSCCAHGWPWGWDETWRAAQTRQPRGVGTSFRPSRCHRKSTKKDLISGILCRFTQEHLSLDSDLPMNHLWIFPLSAIWVQPRHQVCGCLVVFSWCFHVCQLQCSFAWGKFGGWLLK